MALPPQQEAAPAADSAHEELEPASIWVRVTPDSAPVVVTATAVLCAAVVVPFPSWSLPPAPQQKTTPVLASAQAKLEPVVIPVRVTPASTPAVAVTATAVLCVVGVKPFPSWPLPPAPQQKAAPVLASAHAEAPLAVIWVRVNPDSAAPVYTGTGRLLLRIELFPSWPLVPRPQQ